MTPDERHTRIFNLFQAALERPAEHREEFLSQAVLGDRELLADVLSLLAADSDSAIGAPLPITATLPDAMPTDSNQLYAMLESILEEHRRLGGKGSPSSVPNPELLAEAKKIFDAAQPAVSGNYLEKDGFGPYRIVRMIGEGGMGTVYLAQQDKPIRREVALKVVKLGMDSRQVLERFEIERQALALMDHPNIARVYDAGTSDQGRPYFVMEYIDGLPITQYCDQHLLNTRERLELFVPVCMALQHAHQRGVIHRDIKPSNVLVVEQDGKPYPKIIDFGIARATEQRETEHAAFTLLGDLVGTPEYMSPEQTDFSRQDIDTTTDIYSLGVLLYELLAGALPFDGRWLRQKGMAELLRLIREEEPPTPAGRLTALGDTAAEIARCRRTDARTLRNQLSSDLNWIVMKAMDKERTRRYASASELGADIRRHLDDLPVVASPPSTLYRARKFVSRHKLPVLAGLTMAASLVGGLAAVTWEAADARLERNRAERQSYAANLNFAELLLRSGKATEARSRLLLCSPKLRGWEWKHLFLKSDASLATLHPRVDTGDYSELLSRFSFRDDRIYWHSDHWVQSWDATTYRSARSGGPFDYIAALSPDASRIISQVATGGKENSVTLRVVETISKHAIASFESKGKVNLVAFARDGIRALIVTNDGRIILWDTRSGRVQQTIAADPLEVNAVDISADGMRIVSAGTDDVAIVWNATTGKLISRFRGDAGPAKSLQFSPDGSRIVTGSADGTIQIWEASTGHALLTMPEKHGAVYSIAFSPDGSKVAAGTDDNVIRIWDAASGSQLSNLPGNEYRVESLAFTPDGAKLVSAHRLGPVLRVWDASSDPGVRILTGQRTMISSMCFSGDDKLLASAAFDGTVRLVDTQSGKTLRVVSGHRGGARAVACSPTGPYLVSGSADPTLRIWDMNRGELIRTIAAHDGAITAIAFSKDGAFIASASLDKTIKIWAFKSGRLTRILHLANSAGSLDFSSDGRQLVSGSGNGAPIFQVWDVATGKLAISLSLQRENSILSSTGPSPARIAYSPDGSLIAGGSFGPPVNIWDATTGKTVSSLSTRPTSLPPSLFLGSLSWSPDGTRLAIAWNNEIQIWDAMSHEDLMVLDEPFKLDRIFVVFSHNGTMLASGSEDGTIRLFGS